MTVDPERAQRAADSRRSRVDDATLRAAQWYCRSDGASSSCGNAINPGTPFRASAARNGPLVSLHVDDAHTEGGGMRSRSDTR